MIRIIHCMVLATLMVQHVVAETLRVPQDYKTIQAAIDAAVSSDTVFVAPGRYSERIRLKPGIRLRSEGDDARGMDGLRRAEATILDGGGDVGNTSGVIMAEGSTLDGFTVTNVGNYNEALWQKHRDSHGEELGDDEGSVQAEGTTPAISIQHMNCVVTNCIVHHNGDVGIGILGSAISKSASLISRNIVYRNMGGGIGVAEGAEPFISGNICRENLRAGIGCRQANPIIADNECFQNIRAGIGSREGSKPLIRGNKCYQNRRAGIGIRMPGTAPVVEMNDCYENEMAGIGCRDGANPVLRNNICRTNKLAGIGCDGASPMIVSNECRDNEQAGIGVQGNASAVIHGNTCHNNKLVAVGVTEGSTATITENHFARSGGVPPIIAIKDSSTAILRNNQIEGGGVAAVLVQGQATISGNRFTGRGEKQGNAVWVRDSSTATVFDNSFHGYRTALQANQATVIVMHNQINQFQATAIIVKNSPSPVHIYGNTGISTNPKAKVVDAPGSSGIVEKNTLMTK